MSNDGIELTPQQQEKERALFLAIALDGAVFGFLATSGILSGSMTAMAEVIRITLLWIIEIVTYMVLRRAHRGRFSDYEYGTGKIERITNLLVAFGLLLSAIYIFVQAVSMDEGAPLSTTSLMLTMLAGTANLMVNYYCTVDFMRANQEESSVIVSSQIAARYAKTVASIVVLGVLMLTLWLPDPKSARMVDLAGSLFMVGYMTVIAWGLIKESLPEILDRTIPEPEHFQILRILAEHFDQYDGFSGYQARRSGKDMFILLKLRFFPGRTLEQIEDLMAPIRQSFAEELPGSTVTIEPEIMEEIAG